MLKLLETLFLWLLSLLPKTPMSTASTILSAAESLVSAAVPGLGTATAGLKLSDDLVNAAVTIRNSYQQPDMVLDDEQKKRLAAANAILEMQETGDVAKMRATLGSLSAILLACVLSLALSACSLFQTVAPTHNVAAPSYDSSTPPQYPKNSSGYLGDEGKIHLLSNRGRDAYNAAMVRYAPQLRTYFNVAQVAPDTGVARYVDRYGNLVWQIDDEHMQDFLRAADIASNPALYPMPPPK